MSTDVYSCSPRTRSYIPSRRGSREDSGTLQLSLSVSTIYYKWCQKNWFEPRQDNFWSFLGKKNQFLVVSWEPPSWLRFTSLLYISSTQLATDQQSASGPPKLSTVHTIRILRCYPDKKFFYIFLGRKFVKFLVFSREPPSWPVDKKKIKVTVDYQFHHFADSKSENHN